MKKFLAVLLAVVFAFSAATAAFAVDVPAFPEQEAGKLYFVAENTFVKPNAEGEYTVPIYLVADIDAPEGAVKAVLGFRTYVAGSGLYAEMVSCTISDELKAYSGYEYIEDGYNNWEDENGDISFAADASILKESKLHVADVVVRVNDTFTGGEEYASVEFSPANIAWSVTVPGDGFSDQTIWAVNGFEGTADFADADNMPMNYNFDTENGGNYFFVYGYLYEKPYEPTFTDKLVDWLKGFAKTIIESIVKLLELVQADLTK